MSAFYDRAEEIKTKIEGLFEPSECLVVVDRQKDIKSEFAQKTGRIRGGVAIVRWSGMTDINQDVDTLRGRSRYNIIVYCKPILRSRNALKCDDIIQTICGSLHNWQPDNTVHCAEEVKIVSVLPQPDPDYLVYNITAEQLLTTLPNN